MWAELHAEGDGLDNSMGEAVGRVGVAGNGEQGPG